MASSRIRRGRRRRHAASRSGSCCLMCIPQSHADGPRSALRAMPQRALPSPTSRRRARTSICRHGRAAVRQRRRHRRRYLQSIRRARGRHRQPSVRRGPYGAEVERSNYFFGYTFDANESTRYFLNLLGGRTQSNDYNQRGIPHLAVAMDDANLRRQPVFAGERPRRDERRRASDKFVIQKQGTVLGQVGQLGRQRGPPQPVRQLDAATRPRQGHRRQLADAGALPTRRDGSLHRGVNEMRVDREMLAIDAVEVYTTGSTRRGNGAPTASSTSSPKICAAPARSSATSNATTRRTRSCSFGRGCPRAGSAGRRFARLGDPPIPCRSRGRSARTRSRTACR